MSTKRITMRIIAGKYRHRTIYWPDDTSIRPTKDRIREAIFSSLGNQEGMTFLDLYSGSGSMGIEAISRGAKKTYFIDKSITAIKCIKENVNLLSINEAYEIRNMSDMDFLKFALLNQIKFDVIFLDPPYQEGEYEKVIAFIYDNDLLANDGIIVAETERLLNIDESLYKEFKVYKYGEIKVYKMRK